MGRNDDGFLHFEMVRPGKKYQIQLIPDARAGQGVRVEERRTGLRSILGFMHGSTEEIPNAPVTRAWGYYTEITNWFVLFAVGSGIWLWMRRSQKRRVGLILLIGSLVTSLALMAYLYWKG